MTIPLVALSLMVMFFFIVHGPGATVEFIHLVLKPSPVVLDLLAVRLIGIVPEDESVIVGTNRGAPIAMDPKSIAGQAFRNIARRLCGEDVPFISLDHRGSIWERIQRITGRK